MWPECVVRLERSRNQVRPRRLYASIDNLPVVAVWPAIKTAVAYRRHVVGYEVASQFVALVDGSPEHAAFGLPCQPDRIAQARGEQAPPSRLEIDLPNRSAAFFFFDAILADVAVGADGGVQLHSVGTGNDVLCPVMIEGAGRQVGYHRARCSDSRLPRHVRKANDSIGIRDVQRLSHQGHAKRRFEPVDEDAPVVGDTVAIRIAQQCDPVGTRRSCARLRHEHLHEPAPDAFAVIRLRGRVGFGNQYVAIGQHMNPPRMIQAFGKTRYRHTRCHYGLRPGRPAFGCRDVDGRNDGGRRVRQDRIGPHAGGNWKARDVTPGQTGGRDGGHHQVLPDLQGVLGSVRSQPGHESVDERAHPPDDWQTNHLSSVEPNTASDDRTLAGFRVGSNLQGQHPQGASWSR